MEVKKIAKQILQDKPDVMKHTERVVELCTKFSTRLDMEVNMKRLHAAAWLHDASKTVDNRPVRKPSRSVLKVVDSAN